jgi:ferrous iron transport protein A
MELEQKRIPATSEMAAESAGMPLAELAVGMRARVLSVAASDAAQPQGLGRRLAELGFLPGEAVRIVARGFLARAPIAVRIGTSTFALRRFEAACIRVRPEPSPLG